MWTRICSQRKPRHYIVQPRARLLGHSCICFLRSRCRTLAGWNPRRRWVRRGRRRWWRQSTTRWGRCRTSCPSSSRWRGMPRSRKWPSRRGWRSSRSDLEEEINQIIQMHQTVIFLSTVCFTPLLYAWTSNLSLSKAFSMQDTLSLFLSPDSTPATQTQFDLRGYADEEGSSWPAN